MNKFLTSGSAVLAIGLLLSCGSGEAVSMDAVVRPAVDVPDLFEPPLGLSLGDNACKSPMLDPRDDTEIMMVRSYGTGVGDYEVPVGFYGVQSGELLRLNCNTGEVVGIVRK